MKWTCEKCGAINPQFSYKCHNCGESSPQGALEDSINSGAQIVMMGRVEGPNSVSRTYWMSDGSVHTIVSRWHNFVALRGVS